MLGNFRSVSFIPFLNFIDKRIFFLKGRFPPLLSIFPWLPIFYDKLTYQTFIFSPTGGSKKFYLVNKYINFYCLSLYYATID
jgi:hypothetical protein